MPIRRIKTSNRWRVCDTKSKPSYINTPRKYTWCCKWHTFQQTNCHLIPAVVYRRHDVAEAESNCGDMSHCSYTRGDCRLRDKSRLIWTPDERTSCKFQPFQTAEGTYISWNHHWLSEKLQLLFMFHNLTYFTDYNNTVLIKSDEGVCTNNIFRTNAQLDFGKNWQRYTTKVRKKTGL